MWLQAHRKSSADDGSSLEDVTQTCSIKSHASMKQKHITPQNIAWQHVTKKKQIGVLVVSALAEKSADALQEGRPVWLMCKQGQKIRPVGRGSSWLKWRNGRRGSIRNDFTVKCSVFLEVHHLRVTLILPGSGRTAVSAEVLDTLKWPQGRDARANRPAVRSSVLTLSPRCCWKRWSLKGHLFIESLTWTAVLIKTSDYD